MAQGMFVWRGGEWENGLNKLGLVAKQQWEKLPRRFPNIALSTFVIMPNHMHGIIEILAGSRGTAEDPKNFDVQPTRRAPTHDGYQKPVKGSIPTIIRSCKSAASYRINLIRGTQDIPVWQRNYYEHIIRNEKDLQNKTDYINADASLWEQDDENPNNVKL